MCSDSTSLEEGIGSIDKKDKIGQNRVDEVRVKCKMNMSKKMRKSEVIREPKDKTNIRQGRNNFRQFSR